MPAPDDNKTFQIDIVSDVVCPWCIIGFLQLERALKQTGLTPRIRWHPFELNPDMPPEGQNLRQHLAEKYRTTPQQGRAVRQRLTDLGEALGFAFNFDDDSRMVNTFLAHQLIEWAGDKHRQSDMKLALFKAHFTDRRDVSDIAVLAGIAGELGLDRDEAAGALNENRMAWNVRAMQKFWAGKGVRGVPAMIFAGKHLLTGAQGVDTYVTVLQRSDEETG